MFATQIYAARRKRLASLMGQGQDQGQSQGLGLVLLLGNDESPRNYAANFYPFRQDSSFLYFCGLDMPRLAMVLDLDSGEEMLFGDDVTLDDIVWMGPQPKPAEMAEQAGVATTFPLAKLAELLRQAHQKSRTIHFLPPYRHANMIALKELLGVDIGVGAGTPPETAASVPSLELIKAVVQLRSIKSAEEIGEIERAADITAVMHLAAMQAARAGLTEAEVAAAVRQVTQAAEGGTSFPIILSRHGEILHNQHHHGVFQDGDLVLCDAGAETGLHYAADMTRTFPIATTFNTRQRDVYQVVLAAEETASAAIAPGVPYLDVHLLAARTIAAGLGDLGIMKGDVEEAVVQGAHALFFPHGLGHMIGLDVHDMEDLGEDNVGYADTPRSSQFGLKYLRLARELQPGFVLTVEPGIYFIPALIDRWRSEGKFTEFIDYKAVQAYEDFGGIRIEEDFLVIEDGGRLLGKPAPKTIPEIEAVRASGQ